MQVVQAVLEQVVGALNLTKLSPARRVVALEGFFANRFQYSLKLQNGDKKETPLAHFLLQSRTGHCEFFATATTLLLRQAGIPARYMVGYSVQEYDDREGLFVVRRSHAHAWTLAHVDGVWRQVDTTPPDWLAFQQKRASSWQALSDRLSALIFRFAKWRAGERTVAEMGMALLMALLAGGWLIWRRWRGGFKGGSTKRSRSSSKETGRRGHASPLDPVMAHLEQQEGARPAGEPLTVWIQRLGVLELRPLIYLHYRLRFDPRGLSPEESVRFQQGVQRWLARRERFTTDREGS
ncbi:MAG: transglutaminase domain-containing protein [Magnetococcales bacterium]|nr:transglutaminase domain-containing protein [Magnetococcales bacterium]